MHTPAHPLHVAAREIDALSWARLAGRLLARRNLAGAADARRECARIRADIAAHGRPPATLADIARRIARPESPAVPDRAGVWSLRTVYGISLHRVTVEPAGLLAECVGWIGPHDHARQAPAPVWCGRAPAHVAEAHLRTGNARARLRDFDHDRTNGRPVHPDTIARADRDLALCGFIVSTFRDVEWTRIP